MLVSFALHNLGGRHARVQVYALYVDKQRAALQHGQQDHSG